MTQSESPDSHPNSVHLTVESVKKSVRFYRDKLGFELRSCFPDEKKPVWASLVLGGQIVMVGAEPTAEAMKACGAGKDEVERAKKDAKAFGKHPHGVGVLLYLMVPDVDALAKSAKKKKVVVVAPPKTQFYGIREVCLEDLDGYRLVFYTPVAHAPAAEQASEPPKARSKRPAKAGGAAKS